MSEARRCLQEGQLSIAGIADRLTFDTSNFTKFFKRFEGITPSVYRQRLAEKTESVIFAG
jgi:AraC family transcriptional regulator of adaptative response / methylphosphotriester-DNA alkyltransferase methyltransferase